MVTACNILHVHVLRLSVEVDQVESVEAVVDESGVSVYVDPIQGVVDGGRELGVCPVDDASLRHGYHVDDGPEQAEFAVGIRRSFTRWSSSRDRRVCDLQEGTLVYCECSRYA